MKKKLYLASGNRHKKQEMQQILSDYEIRIPADDGIDFDPVEDGSSFYENSLIKAKALWNLVHEAVIADDSAIHSYGVFHHSLRFFFFFSHMF